MGRTASDVGMMSGAFFVSRTELIQWVNGLLAVNLTKVEQCASGAVYCQILDSCQPGTVKMAKVNWMARADHEFLPNYKILQQAFERNGIEKHIDVDKLIRAKYQDNLEFLQWMKCYWDHECAGKDPHEYDAVRGRDGRPVPAWAKPLAGMPVPRATGLDNSVEKENVGSNREPIASGKAKVASQQRSAAPAAATGGASAARPTTPGSAGGRPVGAASKTPRGGAPHSQEFEELRLKSADQAQEIDELKSTLDGLERERDYYFRKLRNVEILCETLQAKMSDTVDAEGIIKEVQGILYAENDEDDAQNDLEPIQGLDEAY